MLGGFHGLVAKGMLKLSSAQLLSHQIIKMHLTLWIRIQEIKMLQVSSCEWFVGKWMLDQWGKYNQWGRSRRGDKCWKEDKWGSWDTWIHACHFFIHEVLLVKGPCIISNFYLSKHRRRFCSNHSHYSLDVFIFS